VNPCWRVVHTGLRPAAQNIALDRALLEARQADEIPSTLRFLRYPTTALLGCGQSAEQQFDLQYCHSRGIAVQRCITSGGGMTGESQLGWQLYLHCRDPDTHDRRSVVRRVAHAAATAISALGVDARCRAHGDIEIDGRRLACTTVATDGGAVLIQGMIRGEFDAEEASRIMRTPAGANVRCAPDLLRQRETGLAEFLRRPVDSGLLRRNLVEAFESEFGVEFREGELTYSEHGRYQAALRAVATPDWIHMLREPASAMPVLEGGVGRAGGLLRARVLYDMTCRVLCQVWFEGDFLPTTARTLLGLEAALSATPVSRLDARIGAWFGEGPASVKDLKPEDLSSAVRQALGQRLYARDARGAASAE